MYLKTKPLNYKNIITDLADFASNFGFSIIHQDDVVMRNNNVNYWETNNNKIKSYGINGLANNVDVSCTRLVFKDPVGLVYYHLVAYQVADLNREGAVVPTAMIDFYMSTGWRGADGMVDDHPEIINCGSLNNMPATIIEAVEFFGGFTSEGKRTLHVCIEDLSQCFIHFALGNIEKRVKFTGGDFVSVTHCYMLNGASSTNQYSYVYNSMHGISSSTGIYNRHLCSVTYARDLDTPFQNPSRTVPYRSIGGHYSWGRSPGVSVDYGMSAYCTSYGGYGEVTSSPYLYGSAVGSACMPQPNHWTQSAVPFKIHLATNRYQETLQSGIFGEYANVRAIDISLYDTTKELTMGSGEWAIRPLRAKSGQLSAFAQTGSAGIAILK